MGSSREEEKEKETHTGKRQKKKMAQRLSPDRRQGDFPGGNRSPRGPPKNQARPDLGSPLPSLPRNEVGWAEGPMISEY